MPIRLPILILIILITTMTAAACSTMGSNSDAPPTPTPDIEATVQARLSELTANATPATTPSPTAAPTQFPTAAPPPSPFPTTTPTPFPTDAPPPFPTAAPTPLYTATPPQFHTTTPTPSPTAIYPYLYSTLSADEKACLGDEIKSQQDFDYATQAGPVGGRTHIDHLAMRCLTDPHRFHFYMLGEPEDVYLAPIHQSTHACIWPAYLQIYDSFPSNGSAADFRQHTRDQQMLLVRNTVTEYCVAIHQPYHPGITWNTTDHQTQPKINRRHARTALCVVQQAGGLEAWVTLIAERYETSGQDIQQLEDTCHHMVTTLHTRVPEPEFYQSLSPSEQACLGPDITSTTLLLAAVDPWSMEEPDQPINCLDEPNAFIAFVSVIDDSHHYPQDYHTCMWSEFKTVFQVPEGTDPEDFWPNYSLLRHVHNYCLQQADPKHPELPYIYDDPQIACFFGQIGLQNLDILSEPLYQSNPIIREALRYCSLE